MATTNIVWDNGGNGDVQSFFKSPPWLPSADQTSTGSTWYGCMVDNHNPPIYLFDTPNQLNNVPTYGISIYKALLNKSMPLGYSPWPAQYIEQFRLWYNDGCRVHPGDPTPGPNGPGNIPPPTPTPPTPIPFPANPVWDASGGATPDTQPDIRMCFTNPSWASSDTAEYWRSEMGKFQFDALTNTFFDMTQYEHVQGWARNIYFHVLTKQMPPSGEDAFPSEACEAIRNWYNQGCRQYPSDKLNPAPDPIPPPALNPNGTVKFVAAATPLIRKDINTLSAEELTNYRMAILNLKSNAVSGSTWQQGGFIHADWCLHYMQASFPWHRAHLLWLESQVGMAVPYWNFYSSKATDPTSADSGIPQAFLDDTFVGSDGKIYPNPLLHALARGGISRASTATQIIPEIQRAPYLSPGNPNRSSYISSWVPQYQSEIYTALNFTTIDDYRTTMFTPNFEKLNDLLINNPDSVYGASNLQNFDGALEQAHDNLHGWCGPDMSNNSYAAFDPLFWSFHANFDRLFETWSQTNQPKNWKSFPLQPFQLSGSTMTSVEGDPNQANYVSTLNMIVPSTDLGYAYTPPGNPDYVPTTVSASRAPIVVFPDTKCTDKTYFIHVALDDGKKLVLGEPGYIGCVTRLGMGPNNGNDRCITQGIIRKLEATKAVADVGGIKPDSEVKLKMLVVEDGAGGPSREVPESEYSQWLGFRPLVYWDKPVGGVIAH